MLIFKFHYSPTSKFGEYEFEYDTPISKDVLRYPFEYSPNEQNLIYSFVYEVFENALIEDDVLIESSKDISIESTIEYLNQSIEGYNESNDIPMINYTATVRDVFKSIVDIPLNAKRRLKKEDIIIESKQNQYKTERELNGTSVYKEDSKNAKLDFLKGERNRSHNIFLDYKGDVKVDFIDSKTVRRSNIKLESVVRKYNEDNNGEDIFRDEFTPQMVKYSTRDIRLFNSTIEMLKKTDRDIKISESLSNLTIDKDIFVEGYNLLQTDKDMNYKEDSLLLTTEKHINISDTIQARKYGLEDMRVESSLVPKFVSVQSKDINSKYNYLFIDKEPSSDVSVISDEIFTNRGSQRIRIDDKISNIVNINKQGFISEGVGSTLERDRDEVVIEHSIEAIEKGTKDISSTSDAESTIKKDSKRVEVESDINLDKDSKSIATEEDDEGLSLHKRFWFLDHFGKMDYKILPNVDFDYPMNLEILESPKIEGVYKYSYTSYFTDVKGDYELVAYDKDFNRVRVHKFALSGSYSNTIDNIEIDAQMISYSTDKHQINFNIVVHQDNISYFRIRQPKDIYGSFFSFVIGEKILNESHPIPIGEDLGLREIPIPIPIMVDFVNMILLVWSKFHSRFAGYQGVQAIDGMAEIIHEWLTLETSLEVDSIEDYHRCFRWFRWECEKVRNRAKYDPDLSGNLWVEEVVFELVDYMEMHHFDILPEWDDISRMDEHRNNIFTEVDFDITIIVDKLKGVRKRVLRKNKRYRDS